MLKNKVLGLFVVSSILAAVAGCSGDDASSDAPGAPAGSGEAKPGEETPASTGPSAPAAPQGTFTLGVPAEVMVRGGGSVTIDVAIAKGAGFTADVALEVGALPDGVTAKIDGAKITLEAIDKATFGDAPLVVRGKGGGITVEETRALIVAGAAGTLDQGFATSGIADGIAQTHRGLGMDGQGRLYASGIKVGLPGKAFIVRYDANGAKDATYGDNAGVSLLMPTGWYSSAGYELHTYADGTSIVSLWAHDSVYGYACVTKVDPAGHVVKTFGTEGFACMGENGKTISPSRLVVLADGSILHGGVFADHAYVEKLTAAGQRDETFGSKGLLPLSVDQGKIIGLAVDSQGRIVVGEALTASSPLETRVWRFTAKGAPDATFNSDGTPGSALAKYGMVDSTMNAMAVGPKDEIYLGGSLGLSAGFISLDASGKANATFNTVGLQNFPLYDQSPVTQLRVSSGKLVAVGKSTASGTIRPFAAGIGFDAQLDESFGTAGKLTYGDAEMMDASTVVRAHGRMTFVSSKSFAAPAKIIRVWE